MVAEICGYDEDFIEDPPDYLKCSVCTFVLNMPVQFECGHRCCGLCLESFKKHQNENGLELTCPIDRTKIKMKKTFFDKGIERLILGLRVRCSRKYDGCAWMGELRNLQSHLDKCNQAKTNDVIDELKDRLVSCEKRIEEKDLAFVCMRENFESEIKICKKEMDEKDVYIDEMETKLGHFKLELKGKDLALATLKQDVMKIKNEFKESLASSKEEFKDHLAQLENRLKSMERKKKRDQITINVDNGDVSDSIAVDKPCSSKKRKREYDVYGDSPVHGKSVILMDEDNSISKKKKKGKKNSMRGEKRKFKKGKAKLHGNDNDLNSEQGDMV